MAVILKYFGTSGVLLPGLLGAAACSGSLAADEAEPEDSDTVSMEEASGEPSPPGADSDDEQRDDDAADPSSEPTDHPAAEEPTLGVDNDDGPDDDSDEAAPESEPSVRPMDDPRFALGPTLVRRLTRAEAAASLQDLFGEGFSAADVELLPGDSGGGDSTPFDNDATQQSASAALIEAIAAIAEGAASQVLASAEIRGSMVPCEPVEPADAACFADFVREFGSEALRRPVTEEEVTRFAALLSHADEAGDFNVAVALAVRALLQDMEFWYRVQIGTTVSDVPADSPPLLQLDGYEIASRLSYLLTGSAPTTELRQSAAQDALSTPQQVRAAAEQLLEQPRARDRVSRFHAMWLGYENSNLPSRLLAPMRRESDALIQRIVFDEPGSWFELFRATETFIDAPLAEHYGLDATIGTEPEWVSYGDSGRRGLLSHGTFLSAFGKFQDTSPTQRGILIRERLACQVIPPPPPNLAVNVDEPPQGEGDAACKVDRYAQHRQDAGCAGCHEQMDPIGFGLEQYDNLGRFRSVETDNHDCEITGDGELVGVGEFNGPAELGELLVESGLMQACVARQFFRFAQGRYESDGDEAAIAELGARFDESGQRFDELLLDFVSLPAFGYRVVE